MMQYPAIDPLHTEAIHHSQATQMCILSTPLFGMGSGAKGKQRCEPVHGVSNLYLQKCGVTRQEYTQKVRQLHPKE